MARLYLDTNILFDILIDRNSEGYDYLGGHDLYISPLSIHVLFYTQKIKVPDPLILKGLPHMNFVSFSSRVLKKAMAGPTADLEDNIQLHSSAEAEADYFVTRDDKLLSMIYFGKAQMVRRLTD